MKYGKIFFIVQISLLLLSLNAAAEEYKSYILKYRDSDEVRIISREEKEYLSDTASLYGEFSEIEYIEPNYPVTLFDNDKTAENWSLKAVKADFAKEYGCCGNNVRVAVIDSGLYTEAFPEGCISEGYSFVSGTSDVTDNVGHGTFVSSIICGSISDKCMDGVAPKVQIIPIKCFDNKYSTTASVIGEAVDYAVNVCKCDVINMSFGMNGNSLYLKEKIDNALEKGVIIAASVGNDGTETLKYPASYDNIVGVGAVDGELLWCSFSQHNASVDVVAPGDGIYGYAIKGFSGNSGTSFSAPHVSAAAAIAKCISPDITAAEFNELIQKSSYDLGEAGYDSYYGYGLLDIEKISQTLINEYEVFVSPINVDGSNTSVTVCNNGASDLTAVNVFAAYDGDVFEKCHISDLNLRAGEKTNVKGISSEKSITYFIWSSKAELLPLVRQRRY